MSATNEVSNNKRIAKNSLLLYLRMMITIAVGLFTSRVTLQVLGIQDYGLYNVIASFVITFAFFSTSLSSAASRYIAFYIGKDGGKGEASKKVFGNILLVHFGFAAFIFLVAETFGLWYVRNKLQIPVGREEVAFWVYQFSIISTMLITISSPYNAAIIAYEKMSAFAYISILDCILKLLIVYVLLLVSFDKLIFYSALFMGIQVLDRIIYGLYCVRHFSSTQVGPSYDKSLFYGIFKFIGWSLIGNFAVVGQTQGLGLILNLFWGTCINASHGIAVQVQNVIKGFCVNFQMAVNPQIFKKYANGEIDGMHNLLLFSSRISYCLLLAFCLPFLYEPEAILKIWLTEVPEQTENILRVILLTMLLFSLSNPLTVSIRATGNIKTYQIAEGLVLLLALPLSYIYLSIFSAPPVHVFVIVFITECLAMLVRAFIVLPKIGLKFRTYFGQVVMPVVKISVTSIVLPSFLSITIEHSLLGSLCVCISSVLSTATCTYLWGLNCDERKYVKRYMAKITHYRQKEEI